MGEEKNRYRGKDVLIRLSYYKGKTGEVGEVGGCKRLAEGLACIYISINNG